MREAVAIPSKASRRVRRLLLSTDPVGFARIGATDWVTDRHVLLSAQEAGVHLPAVPDGWYQVAASELRPPVTLAGASASQPIERLLARLEPLTWAPVEITDWAIVCGDKPSRLLVGPDGPVWVNSTLLSKWQAVHPTLTLATAEDRPLSRLLRVTVGRPTRVTGGLATEARTVGYICPVRVPDPPPCPDLSRPGREPFVSGSQ